MSKTLFNIFPLGGNGSVSFICADADASADVIDIANSNGQSPFTISMIGCQPMWYVIPICACNPIIAVTHEYALETNQVGSLFALVESLLSAGEQLYNKKQRCFDDAVPGHRVLIENGKSKIIRSEARFTKNIVDECLSIKSVRTFYEKLQTQVLTSADIDAFVHTFVDCGEKVTGRLMEQSGNAVVAQN